MSLFDKVFKNLIGTQSNDNQIVAKHYNLPSKYLERGVTVDVFLPPQYQQEKKQSFPVVFFNDGQDFPRLNMRQTLFDLFSQKKVRPFVTIGIHCNENRINEYGVAREADYKNRGNKAQAYREFVLHELIPTMREEFRLKTEPAANAFAGFSLGGLSAMDIAWGNPSVFGKVGVFSGSFWWRSREWTAEDPDGGRIMLDILDNSAHQPGMRFWLQVGTRDEECDRNNNGVIDAIDDTLDVINALVRLGYRPHEDVKYVEVDGGEHNPDTWGKVMPDFLTWIYGHEVHVQI